MKLPKKKDVTFRFTPHPEEMDYRKEFGGMPDQREYIERIRQALKDGDRWAWCWVECTAEWNGFTGRDTLGGCSLYKGEKDFIRCWGKDMKAQAFEDLCKNIEAAHFKMASVKGAVADVVGDMFYSDRQDNDHLLEVAEEFIEELKKRGFSITQD